MKVRHWTGQGVSPVYEGFDTNPDGSHNMWFGYMNRNYEEELDIPVGPDNSFDPGSDRRFMESFGLVRFIGGLRGQVTLPRPELIQKPGLRCLSSIGQGKNNQAEGGAAYHFSRSENSLPLDV